MTAPAVLRVASLLLASALVITTGSIAEARSEKTVGWDAAKVYPAAVRFLRIDVGATVIEKDAEAGYVLFELREEGRTFRGALEIVKIDKDGREQVRLVLSIADRPEYVEVALLDRLEAKLRSEHGSPRRDAPKPGAPAKP